MYQQHQNKWYPRRFLLVHLEATLYFSRTKFTCPSYYGQVNSLRLKLSVASKYASKNLLGVLFILLLMVATLSIGLTIND